MRKIITYLFILSTQLGWSQHTPIITQYMFNGIALNPALTGSEEAFSVIGTYRAQWIGLEGAPQTQALSVHAPMKKENSAFGLQFFADQIGVTRQTGIYLSYSYKLKFKKSYLRLGIAGGTSIIRTNYSNLEVVQQNDANLTENFRGVLPDFSFGLHYYSKRYFASFSIPLFLGHQFNGTNYKVYHDFGNYNYMLGMGYKFSVNESVNLKPSFLLKYRTTINPQIDVNFMAEFNKNFEAGIGYRSEESIIFLFKYRANDQFSLMYSFGIPLSSIGAYSYGSHEIGLKYSFKYNTKISGPRYLGW